MPGRYGTGGLLPLERLAGRYVIVEKIAQGGMGAVYKARDQRLEGKIVAVKEMSESAISHVEREHVLGSFLREAEILARLCHPNLVQVTDRFEEKGRQYMVMEFVEGKTLKSLLGARTEPFPEEQVLIWADQLCDVLTYLHSQEPKIIYRDMKPANVMIVDGTDDVKLIDFGIARFYRPGKRKDTIEMGTDGYAPPEQYGKLQTDERADIYALGALLHHLLTLRDPVTKPFTFPQVSALNPKVSRRVSDAIARAVEGARDKRFSSVEEMRHALLGTGGVRPPAGGAAPPPGKQPAAPPTKKASPPVKRRALPPPAGDVIVSPPALDFGRRPAGSVFELPLNVVIPPGDCAMVHSDAPWLSATPQQVDDEEEIKVRVDTRLLSLRRVPGRAIQARGWVGLHARLFIPAERLASGRIEVVLEGSQKARSVPVTVTVYPTPQQIRSGQIVTLIVLLLEALLALGVLGALCMAAWAMLS